MANAKNKYSVEVVRGTMSTKEGNVKAFGINARVSVNGEAIMDINDIQVKDSSKGMFVAYPQRGYKDKDGNQKWANIVYISSEEMDKAIKDAVLDWFDAQ